MRAVRSDQSLGLTSYAALFAPLPALGRAQVVAQRLTDAVSFGLLPDGTLLPSEADLAASLGVAPVTVREALGQLRADGLIVTRRGRHGGSFVRAPEDQGQTALQLRLRDLGRAELRDLGDHYAAIGGRCAALAASRADAAEISRLADVADRIGLAQSASEILRAEGGFHLELAVIAQSARLTREEIALQGEIGPILWLSHRCGEGAGRAANRHTAIVACIAAGDAPGAQAEVEAHVADLLAALAPIHAGAVAREVP